MILKIEAMKLVLIVGTALAVVCLSAAEDDGQYRPSQYGDEGKYRPIYFRSFSVPAQDLHKFKFPLLDYGKKSSYEATASATAFSPVYVKPVSYYASPKVYDPYYKPYYGRSYNTDGYAKISRQGNDVDANGYNYYYQTDNGIAAQEVGRLAPYGGTKATGFYEYIGDDGVKYRVDYEADENGFRPLGAHLPK